MIRLDLHVHTSRYSECAETLDPHRIEEYALTAGLGGVVLTDHDTLWTEEEIAHLRNLSPGIRIYRGIEVSARGAHLVIIGIEEAGRLPRGIPVDEACHRAHEQGACVILAHPYRDSDPTQLPVELVDAIEIGSTSFTPEEAASARDLAVLSGKPGVAASDAHALSRIGWSWTEFRSIPDDERALARLIRTGKGTAVVPEFLS